MEQLCRYIARPPLSQERLELRADGNYVLHLKTPWSNGTTSLLFSKLEIMEKLAALVPPPHANQVIYHGLFAPRCKWREKLLPMYKVGRMEKGKVGRKLCKVQKQGSVDANGSRWVTWAWLLKYVSMLMVGHEAKRQGLNAISR